MAEQSLTFKTGLSMAAIGLLPFGLPLLLALTEFNSPGDKYRLITINADYLLIVCTWRGYAVAGLFLLGSFYIRYFLQGREEGDFTSRFSSVTTTEGKEVASTSEDPWYMNAIMMGTVLMITINALVYKIVMLIAIISIINTASYKIEFNKNQAYIHTGMAVLEHKRFIRDDVNRAYYKMFRGRNYVRWDLMIDLKDGTELHPDLPMFDDKIKAHLESQWGLSVDRVD